jgi:hypothetical protein
MLNKLKCLIGIHDWSFLISVVGSQITGRMCQRCGKRQMAYLRFKNERGVRNERV